MIACAVVAGAAGAYTLARQTSIFAIRSVQIRGAPPSVAAAVRGAVADWRGTSLVGLDGGELVRRVEGVPWIVSVRYDRAFPHVLRLVVQTERPVAVLRAGAASWLVSARARALARIPRGGRPELPRIWVPAATRVEAGATLGDGDGGAAARALAPLVDARFPVAIRTVELRAGELGFALRSGTELRLGQPTDLRLKLAIARRIVPTLGRGVGYLDVSVPERPVSGTDTSVSAESQVSGGG